MFALFQCQLRCATICSELFPKMKIDSFIRNANHFYHSNSLSDYIMMYGYSECNKRLVLHRKIPSVFSLYHGAGLLKKQQKISIFTEKKQVNLVSVLYNSQEKSIVFSFFLLQ